MKKVTQHDKQFENVPKPNVAATSNGRSQLISKFINENKKFSYFSTDMRAWHKDKPIYHQWEQSMKYISPTLTMGHRIAATPYHAIIIG